MDNAQTQMSWLERMAHKLPGFSGYDDREKRRDADKQQRDFIANSLVRSKDQLLSANQVIMQAKQLQTVTRIDHLCNVIDRVGERIRHASYGYTGFFDRVKIEAADLDRVYQFDAQLIDEAKHVEEGAAAVLNGAAGLDVGSHLESIEKTLQTLDTAVDARQKVMMGVA